jgi:hypothetical protein
METALAEATTEQTQYSSVFWSSGQIDLRQVRWTHGQRLLHGFTEQHGRVGLCRETLRAVWRLRRSSRSSKPAYAARIDDGRVMNRRLRNLRIRW